jgi:hypothetical protein
MTRSKLSILASPLLCLGLLGGIVAEDSTHLKPSDVEPYHATARDVIKSWPETIADGDWSTSVDENIPPSAEQLLHPNCVIDRLYTSGTIRVNNRPAQASLLIVQCKDSRDMAGHFPPNCYPAAGDVAIGDAEPFSFAISGVPAPVIGREYHFRRNTLPVIRRCVYDFFILPGHGFKQDMTDVRTSAGDYQQRYYGAAQFQVVMDADYPQELRESIFKTIIGANSQALTVLNTVEVQ